MCLNPVLRTLSTASVQRFQRTAKPEESRAPSQSAQVARVCHTRVSRNSSSLWVVSTRNPCSRRMSSTARQTEGDRWYAWVLYCSQSCLWHPKVPKRQGCEGHSKYSAGTRVQCRRSMSIWSACTSGQCRRTTKANHSQGANSTGSVETVGSSAEANPVPGPAQWKTPWYVKLHGTSLPTKGAPATASH